MRARGPRCPGRASSRVGRALVAVVGLHFCVVCGAQESGPAVPDELEEQRDRVESFVAFALPRGRTPEAILARQVLPIGEARYVRVAEGEVGREGVDAGAFRLVEVEALADRARAAALAFDLPEAARLRRAAADLLLRSALVIRAPERVARAALSAGAASAEAGSTDLGLLYYRFALAVDGAVRPGPEISPGAAGLFDSASAAGPAQLPNLPRSELVSIAEDAGADGLVLVTVSREVDGIELSERVVRCRAPHPGEETVRRHTALDPSEEGLADGLRTRLTARLDSPAAQAGGPDDGEADERRWYERWWVYAIAGGIIAAGVTTGVVIAEGQEPEPVKVVVHY